MARNIIFILSKNFQNRLRKDEVITKSSAPRFLKHSAFHSVCAHKNI